LIERVLADAALRARYDALIGQALADSFAAASMHGAIDETAALLRPHIAADWRKPYSMAQFDESLIRDQQVGGIGPGTFLVFGLHPFIDRRRGSATAQQAGAPAPRPPGYCTQDSECLGSCIACDERLNRCEPDCGGGCGPCLGDGVCDLVSETCKPPGFCLTPGDCGSCATCETRSHSCVPSCASGCLCPPGSGCEPGSELCRPGYCAADGDCPAPCGRCELAVHRCGQSCADACVCPGLWQCEAASGLCRYDGDPCGDGVCDLHEQTHPEACPADCP
jgi:hypothetical protein